MPSTTPPARPTTPGCTCSSSFDPGARRRGAVRRGRRAPEGRDPARAGRELARRDEPCAATQAGFDTFDVHMSDLLAGRARLDMFQGFVACGGFSYGDTLGAGEGWARSILFNPELAEAFAAFFDRRDTLALGVCNGCQMMAALRPLIPGAQAWPHFTRNRSEQFEARLSMVEVLDSPSAVLRRHGRQPHADRGGARRGPCRLLAAWRCERRAARAAFCRPPRPADRGLPVQPERQSRRTDGGHDCRRPLHGADAAPRARLPQRADEPCRRGDLSASSPWMRMFRNARAWFG